jgi:hypothetical protein
MFFYAIRFSPSGKVGWIVGEDMIGDCTILRCLLLGARQNFIFGGASIIIKRELEAVVSLRRRSTSSFT